MAKRRGKGAAGKSGTTGRARARAVRARHRASPQERALADVTAVLGALDAPSAVIGGIAVIAWGFARFTGDIDCAIAASREEARALMTAFERQGFSARTDDAVAFAEENLVLLLRHVETQVDVDVSLAQLAFEGAALARAVERPFGVVQVRVPQVTDLLVYKLVAGRPKDLQDAEELLARHEVDEARIEQLLREFDELLNTDRVADWRRLLEARV